MKQSRLRSPSRLQPTPHTHTHPHHAAHHHHHQRAQNLQLPGLPRFHPAQFQHATQSTDSSVASSPASGLNSPQAPLSPRQQHRLYSDAQRQLYTFQRDVLNRGIHLEGEGITRAATAIHRSPKPVSPRLQPLGSPGPVTPLELEEEEKQEYFQQHQKGGTGEDTREQQILDSFFQQHKEASHRGYPGSPLGFAAR